MLSHQQTVNKNTSPPKSTSRDLAPAVSGVSLSNPVWQSFALDTARLQPKLTISQPDDPFEREADSIADRVMRMTNQQAASSRSSNISGNIQRKCTSCEEEGMLQRQVSGNTEEPPRSHAAEVEALLRPADPVAGVGNPDAGVALIRDLPMASMLLTLRDLRDHFRLDIIRPQINSSQSTRLRAALAQVDSETPGPVAPPNLPAPLLETLSRSYTRRMSRMPGSSRNIDNAFWGGRPANLSQALIILDSSGALTIIREIYRRWTSAGLTWTVEEIHNIWIGGSSGFNFVPTSIGGLRSALSSAASRFCRDVNLLGGLYHYWYGETPCWREQVSGSRGLHFCLGTAVPSVHIDPTQVVETRESDGTCNYDMSVVYQHFRDLGWVP